MWNTYGFVGFKVKDGGDRKCPQPLGIDNFSSYINEFVVQGIAGMSVLDDD